MTNTHPADTPAAALRLDEDLARTLAMLVKMLGHAAAAVAGFAHWENNTLIALREREENFAAILRQCAQAVMPLLPALRDLYDQPDPVVRWSNNAVWTPRTTQDDPCLTSPLIPRYVASSQSNADAALDVAREIGSLLSGERIMVERQHNGRSYISWPDPSEFDRLRKAVQEEIAALQELRRKAAPDNSVPQADLDVEAPW